MIRTLYNLVLLLAFLPILLFSEENSVPEIVFGVQRFSSQSNFLQNYHIPNQQTQNTDIRNGWGIKGELLLPSKQINALEYVIGAIYQNTSYNNFDTNDNSELVPYLFGGGIYIGLSAKSGSDKFGIIGQLCPGYFVFNQKVNYIDNFESINNMTLINNTTSSLGGKFNIGIYNRREVFTIFPSFYCIIMGLSDKGANSILGFDLSISYKHER